MHSTASKTARVLFVDDNVRGLGGHYLELASLLSDGAKRLGYRPHLLAHAALASETPSLGADGRLDGVDVMPAFDVRRLERWSLGVDGGSRVARDLEGRPSGRGLRRWRQAAIDRLCRPAKRPQAILAKWSETLCLALEQFAPRGDDEIVINTGGDFQLLALARSLEQRRRQGLREALSLHVVFHFAVFGSEVDSRARQFGDQVNAALGRMPPHRIQLHATTRALAEQLRRVGVAATAIPYPTRPRDIEATGDPSIQPPKIVLAGIPRAEKGRDQIRKLLAAVEHSHLRRGRYRWSMQLPPKRWQRYLPASMGDLRQRARSGDATCPLEINHGNLSSDQYHRWLDSADVGLFLYDPERYGARCSGVLLEMMVRGVPAVVPDGCWLADQVRQALPRHQVGWIYRDRSELPDLLDRIESELPRVRLECLGHAKTIKRCHAGESTLLAMGLADRRSSMLAAAG